MSYLIEILEQGVWLGLDRTTEIGAQHPDWRERAHTIVKLIRAGWVPPQQPLRSLVAIPHREQKTAAPAVRPFGAMLGSALAF